MTKEKKKYKHFTLLLDENEPEEKKILDWMKANRTKKLKYADMLRAAMLKYIEQQETK